MKGRIFNIVTDETNPKTGDVILTEDRIKDALAHRTIKRWAYIKHDEDVYTKEDEDKQRKALKESFSEHGALYHKTLDEFLDFYGAKEPEKIEEFTRIYHEQYENINTEDEYIAAHLTHIAGSHKNNHWHIVIEMGTNQAEITTIAKWLGIADNFINVAKGAGAFLDCVQYLTHEDDKQQGLGKRLYADERVHANFDFREELTKRAERKLKYGKDLDDRDLIRNQVLYEGLTLRQLCREKPTAYTDDYSTLDKLRMKYISERAPLPTTRINYYVSGRGGIGKGLICRALARSLYPNIKDDDDIFFEVGAKGVPFEGYDGQPVIIWNDRRAYDLLQELNGRGNVFNIFDTHPTRGKQNVKYSSVNLCNAVNIVNSVQSYTEFLDGLAGEYEAKDGTIQKVEDKGQSYRRFPFIIPLHEDDFDVLMNKGFYEGTKEYTQYIEYKNVRGNMQKIREVCGSNEALAKEIEAKTVKGIVDLHNQIVEKVSHSIPDENAVREQFANYGVMKTPDEIKAEEEAELARIREEEERVKAEEAARQKAYTDNFLNWCNGQKEQIDDTPFN